MATTTGIADDRPRWLSITGAALWVSLSGKTIRRKIAAGELRAYRCGKTIRIKTDDLEAMMRPVPSAKDW
jgi:excisionase family DNA binding protein